MNIRDALESDLDDITAIYEDAVKTGTGSFEITPPDRAEMKRRLEAIQSPGFPWLVAEVEGAVLGYAYAGPFKARAAYDGTVEDSVYVARLGRGKGIGKALLMEVIDRCADMGKTEMIAGIGDSENTGSLALHTACGFRKVGHLENVGFKFGQFRNVVYMQRSLRH